MKVHPCVESSGLFFNTTDMMAVSVLVSNDAAQFEVQILLRRFVSTRLLRC